MNKKIVLFIIVIIIIIALVIGGYFYWENKAPQQKSNQENPSDYETQTAPLEKMPDVNPAAKTNLYKAVKTNPFE